MFKLRQDDATIIGSHIQLAQVIPEWANSPARAQKEALAITNWCKSKGINPETWDPAVIKNWRDQWRAEARPRRKPKPKKQNRNLRAQTTEAAGELIAERLGRR